MISSPVFPARLSHRRVAAASFHLFDDGRYPGREKQRLPCFWLHFFLAEKCCQDAPSKWAAAFFQGENPDDVRMRWIGMAHHYNFDIEKAGVHFIAGAYPLKTIKERARREIEQIGPASLIVVDTATAYSEAHDENDNQQVASYARSLRSMTGMPGGPTVLVLAHPVKNAGPENLLPRGGGALVAEMDGNLTCTKDDTTTRLHWQGKFRGPDFEPIVFELWKCAHQPSSTARAVQIPTVVATVIGRQQELQREDVARSDEEQLLRAMRDNPRASFATLCSVLGWPAKSRVSRAIARLAHERLVKKLRGKWRLTEAGKRETADSETPE